MYVEIGTLPGYNLERRRRRARRRRCKYPKGTKAKARWRHAQRKFKRNKKRQRKRMRSAKSKSSKSTVSSEKQVKKERRKKIRKRKRLRKKKDSRRRHKVKRHLYGTKERKIKAISKKKMTKEQIIQRLAELRMQRIRILHKSYRNRALICSPKRKAIRRLKKCWRRARHQRKKYQRYRRHLEALANRKNLKNWRYCHVAKERKKGQKNVEAPPKKPTPKPSKRVEYVDRYPIKVTINQLEAKNDEVHCQVKKGAQGEMPIDNLLLKTKEVVAGNFGRIGITIKNAGENRGLNASELRWQSQVIHDKTGSREGKILAKLAMLGSPNAVRILYYGQFQNLQCLVTSRLKTFKGQLSKPGDAYTLEDCLRLVQLDMASCVHIIQQTFYCVKDLHKVGYSHLAISPSNFSFLAANQRLMAFTNFEFARTRQSIRQKQPHGPIEDYSRRRKPRRLPKLYLKPYMSRRQHFRMVKGTADDYESWFYVCARVLNEKKPLKWEAHKGPEPLTHMQMAMMKYELLGKYSHPDKLADKKMKHILAYCLSANDTNTKKVAYFIERVIQHWVDKLEKKKTESLPWIDTKHFDWKDAKGRKEFEDDNKKWFKPRKERVCKY